MESADLGVVYSPHLETLCPISCGNKNENWRQAHMSVTQEMNHLGETLINWKKGKTLMASAVPIFAGWLTSWLGAELSAIPELGVRIKASSLFSAFPAFCQATIWGGTSLGLLFLLFNHAFEGKRAIFMPT
jgi:hypothetical protein